MQPKVSIIIPTFNCDKVLETCIESIISQTYSHKEIIIIDGKSTDATLAIIEKYKLYLASWVSEKDKGIYDAMNKGIHMAGGEWLYFMGSDDIFYNKQVLEDVFNRKDCQKYDVIYGNVQFKHSGHIYNGEFTSYQLLFKNICHQSMFTAKHLLVTKGKFNIRYKMLADYAFNMDWFNDKKVRRMYIDLIIAIYNEDGLSFNVTDQEFIRDKNFLINKNFPLLDKLQLRYDIYRGKVKY